LDLVLFRATLQFVGWVELTPSIVGFRCTQPNLHFAGVFARCETQQQPISEPSHNSFFSDQTGCPLAGGGSLMKLPEMTNDGIASGFAFGYDPTGRSVIFFTKQTEFIPSTFDIHYSKFDIRFFSVSFSIKLTGHPRRVNFSGRRIG
jgi:hypothetical protein